MSKLLDRLERLEAEPLNRYPWQTVCRSCAAEGLTSTPREHCEARRCEEVQARIDGYGEEWRRGQREAWEGFCAIEGKDIAEADREVEETIARDREAWEAKKVAILAGELPPEAWRYPPRKRSHA